MLNVLRDNSGSKILVQNGNDRPSPSATGKEAEKPAKEKAPRKPRVTKLEQIVCPECGQGHILKGRTAYGCSRFREGCTLRLPFEEYPAELTPGKLNQAINKLKSRNGGK